MSEQPVNILQITDTHLLTDPQAELLGVKTRFSLEAVLEMIKQKSPRIDFILLTGDLAQDYSEAAYRTLAELMQSFSVPVYCVPGNHDDVGVMMRVYPFHSISMKRHLVLKSWQLILLNSQKPGHVMGRLDTSQLAFLTQCLESYPEHDAMIVFHHHIHPVGSAWLDKLGIENPDDFWAVVKRFPKVKFVLNGHVHQASEAIVHGVSCFTTPSTCVQFKRHQDFFGLEKLPQGCRFIQLHDSGFFETEVWRLNQYAGSFDEHATGY